MKEGRKEKEGMNEEEKEGRMGGRKVNKMRAVSRKKRGKKERGKIEVDEGSMKEKKIGGNELHG